MLLWKKTKLDNAAKRNSRERWVKSPERGLMQVFLWERWRVAFLSFSLLDFHVTNLTKVLGVHVT